MCCKGFIKRVLPFFLTLAVGLFVASFFVSVAAPTFEFKNRGWRKNHRQYDRQREAEIQRLREENIRLQNQLSEMDLRSADFLELKYSVPAPALSPAPPPLTLETIPHQGK